MTQQVKPTSMGFALVAATLVMLAFGTILNAFHQDRLADDDNRPPKTKTRVIDIWIPGGDEYVAPDCEPVPEWEMRGDFVDVDHTSERVVLASRTLLPFVTILRPPLAEVRETVRFHNRRGHVRAVACRLDSCMIVGDGGFVARIDENGEVTTLPLEDPLSEEMDFSNVAASENGWVLTTEKTRTWFFSPDARRLEPRQWTSSAGVTPSMVECGGSRCIATDPSGTTIHSSGDGGRTFHRLELPSFSTRRRRVRQMKVTAETIWFADRERPYVVDVRRQRFRPLSRPPHDDALTWDTRDDMWLVAETGAGDGAEHVWIRPPRLDQWLRLREPRIVSARKVVLDTATSGYVLDETRLHRIDLCGPLRSYAREGGGSRSFLSSRQR